MDIDEAKIRLADVTSDGVLITDAGLGTVAEQPILWCNRSVLDETGYSVQEVVGASATLFHGPETCPKTVASVNAALAAGSPVRTRILNYRKDGSSFWVDLTASLIRTASDGRAYWVAVQRNVNEYVALERRLEDAQREAVKSQERLLAAIKALPDAFVLYDAEDRAVVFNDRYREIYASSASAIVVGARFEDILRAGLANGQYLEAVGREDEWLRERIERHRNPAEKPVEQCLPGDRYLQVREARLSNGDIVGFRTDITTLKRQQRELADKAQALDIAARTDPLTGLLNRRGLDLEIAAAAQAHGERRTFAVLHVDLDRFKPINDVFGHAAGDRVLCAVADILRASIRRDDLVARVGGDEFVVFQKGRASEATANTVSDRILEACRMPVDWNGKPLHFGCSIGIATGTAERVADLLQDADIALYEAKDAGRGRSHFFSPELRRAVQEKKRLSDEILQGIERGEFIAFYQPQVDANDGALVGAEALVRWDHPARGLLEPAAFLPVAEELSILSEIEASVLEHATATVRVMEAAGFRLPSLSFNVSMSRLATLGDAPDLAGYRAVPCRIGFELLETIDFDDELREMSWIIDMLRGRDIAIELDDFGSGRASLTSLLTLRPDRIKIDRQIVSAALRDRLGAGSMVRAIAEMCRGLDIPMTAEGVETPEHAALMRDLGCDRLQGYHITAPVPRAGLLAFAAAWSAERGRQRA